MNKKDKAIYIIGLLIWVVGSWFTLIHFGLINEGTIYSSISLDELKWYELIIGFMGILLVVYLIVYLIIFQVLFFVKVLEMWRNLLKQFWRYLNFDATQTGAFQAYTKQAKN